MGFFVCISVFEQFLPCPGRGGVGGSRVVSLNVKKSRVGALSMFHVAVTVAVGNLTLACRLSRFHFECCRYFLGHVACRNLPWQSLRNAFGQVSSGVTS